MADDRLVEAIAESRAALAGEVAGVRDGLAAAQRDLSRIGRELVRTGATLEALQKAVAVLGPALAQVPAEVNTALARDAARDLARERQLREAAERAALDDVLAALDGLERNLEAGRQLLRGLTAPRPSAPPLLVATPDRPWWQRPLVRAWVALGERLSLPAGSAPATAHAPQATWSVPPAGVESLLDGMQVTYRRLLDALERRGVTAIEATGARFDPFLHEAVAVEPCAADQDGLVLREQRRGYRTADRVVRPAQVVVGRAADPTTDHELREGEPCA